jgi:D-3-phosphoglycerate dehydrogenase
MLIAVNTYPFGECGDKPLNLLRQSNRSLWFNKTERMRPEAVLDASRHASGIIAGTEPYTREILEQCENLRVLARVGVGFDSVDLAACRELGITATYTPDAPSLGVAELTIGLMLDLLRGITRSHIDVSDGLWNRGIGTLVGENAIGVLGVGRIGKHVVRLLSQFHPAAILGCDVAPDYTFGGEYGVEWVGRKELFRRADLVTIHVPLNSSTVGLVGISELSHMNCGLLVNTARGPIVDEHDLLYALDQGLLKGYASDVFTQEPYTGPLIGRKDVILTAHIAASARRTRFLMELGAAEDCLAVLNGGQPRNPIP